MVELRDIPKKYIDPLAPKDKGEGYRVNGKEWKIKKDAFRVKSFGVKKSSFEEREQKKLEEAQFKQRIKDLKDEKDNIRQTRVADIKKRREAKIEKERHERIAAKMSAKKVERLRKKEKRNKLLKER